jgi:hypothetical protein
VHKYTNYRFTTHTCLTDGNISCLWATPRDYGNTTCLFSSHFLQCEILNGICLVKAPVAKVAICCVGGIGVRGLRLDGAGKIWLMLVEYVAGKIWLMLVEYSAAKIWLMLVEYAAGKIWLMLVEYAAGKA